MNNGKINTSSYKNEKPITRTVNKTPITVNHNGIYISYQKTVDNIINKIDIDVTLNGYESQQQITISLNNDTFGDNCITTTIKNSDLNSGSYTHNCTDFLVIDYCNKCNGYRYLNEYNFNGTNIYCDCSPSIDLCGTNIYCLACGKKYTEGDTITNIMMVNVYHILQYQKTKKELEDMEEKNTQITDDIINKLNSPLNQINKKLDRITYLTNEYLC
jgi:hypothetical protein